MNSATTCDGMKKAREALASGKVRLVASRFFFTFDAKTGDWRKKIHSGNPRWAELKKIVDDPARAQFDNPDRRNPHGELLEAYDVYDSEFKPQGHSIVTVCGGYNGYGDAYKWCEYLDEIKGAVLRLCDTFGRAWMVPNGLFCANDVWYATLAFEDRRGIPADGSDHVRCFSDDAAEYENYRTAALAAHQPFGLLDFGSHDYDFVWSKRRGPYPWPKSALRGVLIQPDNTLHQYATMNAAGDCLSPAAGVYPSNNGTQAFYVVQSGDHNKLELDRSLIIALGELPHSDMPFLEDWQNGEDKPKS